MGLRFDPMGGGQFQQLVKQMIEAEREPIRGLENRKALEETRMKLFQDFKQRFTGFRSTLAEFSNFNNFRELKVDLGDGEGLIDVTLDKDRAQPGTYQLEVERLAKRSSIMTNAFEDPEAKDLGIGFVVVETPKGDDVEIYIDPDNASLRGMAAKINTTPNSPIRASVVKDKTDPDAPYRMIITAKNDGSDDEVYIPEFYFLDGRTDIYIDEENDAQNAYLSLDGFPIEAHGNMIEDFLQGVNLNLKQAAPGRPITISITEDHKKVSGKVKGLVDQMNSILKFINDQNKIDDKSDTRATFAGDSGLQSIEYRLRNLLHEGYPVGHPDDEENFRWVRLNEIGIEFNREGLIEFKEEKFTKTLEGDFEGVAEAITGQFGFARQLGDVIDGYTRVGNGMLNIREQAMRDRIRRIDQDIATKERNVAQRAQAITERFARLQGSLANLQRQQSALAAAMPAGGGGGNIISQLMGG